VTIWWIPAGAAAERDTAVASKWKDQSSTAYWNKRLKEEGLETVKHRQIFKKKTGRYSGKPLAQPLPAMKRNQAS
jgi:predicted mannosyl-3-phosphoglycerate phosphatase (HAD superfamily)